MPKDTRDKVTLSPEAFKALEVEAMLHGDSLKDTASKLILKAACPKCKEILDIMARPAKEHKDITTQEPNVPIAQKTEGPMAQWPNDTITQGPDVTTAKGPDVTRAEGPKGPKAKRKKLSEDPIALAKIKEMWSQSPRPTLTAMAKETGYSKSTISDNIKRLKEKRELE